MTLEHDPTAEDIERFASRIERLLGTSYKVESNKEVSNLFGFIKETFDLVIYENNKPYVAIEYKSFIYGVAFKMRKQWYGDRMHKLGIPYAILYYGKDDEVYFYSNLTNRVLTIPLSDAIHAVSSKTSWSEQPSADEFFTEMSFPYIDQDSHEFDENRRIYNELGRLFIEDNLQFDDSKGIVSFTFKAEDEFFRMLLPNEHEERVCRYTTINSLFLTLKKRNHCMLSITCMNDKGELTYADKLAGNHIYSDSDENVSHNNNCFILSCCKEEKTDDLTMWRLYGDNAQGCCILYDLIPERIENSSFFFAPVSYGDSDNHHLQLEYVNSFMKFNYKGWHFQFNRWHIWKHFFKSHHFKDEHEYRLLYMANGENEQTVEWIRDNTNGIISRIKTFDCIEENSFPLSIKGVILGPKCPEQETLVAQLKYMNKKQNVIPERIRNMIRPSIIKDFR